MSDDEKGGFFRKLHGGLEALLARLSGQHQAPPEPPDELPAHGHVNIVIPDSVEFTESLGLFEPGGIMAQQLPEGASVPMGYAAVIVLSVEVSERVGCFLVSEVLAQLKEPKLTIASLGLHFEVTTTTEEMLSTGHYQLFVRSAFHEFTRRLALHDHAREALTSTVTLH